MGPLEQLAIIWIGVFVAGLLANKTRLTSVLYYLAFGALMVNLNVLPTESAPFIRGFAELAFVVMDIAYVQNNILTTEAFYMLMFTAFWLNVAVPITITLWKPYYLKGEAAEQSQPEFPVS